MTSYSKHMMGIAAEWLAANPEPTNPFLTIPREFFLRDTPVSTSIARSRLDRAAIEKPWLAPKLAELRGLVAEVDQAEQQIAATWEEFEEFLNRPWSQEHGKLVSHDDRMNPLGRWFLAWARHGHNAFELSPDFVAAMLLTDHREVELDMVQLPFPGMLLFIPAGFACGVEGDAYTKIHVLEVGKREFTEARAQREVSSALASLDDDARLVVLAKAQRDLALVNKLGGVSKRSLVDTVDGGARRVPRPAKDDRCLFIYATDGKHALHTFVERTGLTWDKLEALPEVDDDADRQALRTIWRVVFGALAYMTAVERALEPREAAPPRKGAGGKPAVRHWDVGRTIKLAPELVRAARGGSREIALQVKHRFIVRGHYRNQVHGEGRRDRKRIWIRPFWKGPEEGAMLVHTYKLDKEPA